MESRPGQPQTEQKPNGIAENAVRGVKEGNSALLVQVFSNSGGEKRWNASVVCETCKTN